jgi:hypothetical protein
MSLSRYRVVHNFSRRKGAVAQKLNLAKIRRRRPDILLTGVFSTAGSIPGGDPQSMTLILSAALMSRILIPEGLHDAAIWITQERHPRQVIS